MSWFGYAFLYLLTSACFALAEAVRAQDEIAELKRLRDVPCIPGSGCRGGHRRAPLPEVSVVGCSIVGLLWPVVAVVRVAALATDKRRRR